MVQQTLNQNDIHTQIARLDADARRYDKIQTRLQRIYATLTRDGIGQEARRARARLGQVQLLREAVADEKARLLEQARDAQARMLAVRLRLEVERVMSDLREDARYSRELRFALRAVRTVYGKWWRHRQDVYARLARLNAQPDAASWRTWTESPLLYLTSDAIPLAEFRALIQDDIQRKRLLSLVEWKAHNGLRVAVDDGSALRAFFKNTDDATLQRVHAAVRTDLHIAKILRDVKSVPEKPVPKQSVPKKHQKNRKRAKS